MSKYQETDYGTPPSAATEQVTLNIDGQSITDNSVTIRDRDTLRQERVDAARVADVMRERLTQ